MRENFMLQISKSEIRCAMVAVALTIVPAVGGQQTNEPAGAPIPSQIAAAHKVFISNGGADVNAQAAFKRAGEPEEAYNHFYMAMQSWGRYELVTSPADADLVFELRFTSPMYMNGNLAIYQPQFGLRVLDAKTHFLLWNVAEPVEGAFRKDTWLKNFGHGLDALMDDLRRLSTPPAASDPSKR
jgi:hypothetical protein